jgi:CHAD domain-containing protein
MPIDALLSPRSRLSRHLRSSTRGVLSPGHLANPTGGGSIYREMPDEIEQVEKALRDLGKSLKRMPADPPPEKVHKLRTSARRVEAIAAALPQIKGKKSHRLVKSIKPLRKAAGSVRDMDVLVANLRKLAKDSEGDSLPRLMDHLEFVRASGAGELHRAMHRKRKTARTDLKKFAHEVHATLPPPESTVRADHAARANGQIKHARNGHKRNGMNPAAKHLARELAEWPRLSEQNIHDFRLKVKALRYILQLDASADTDFVSELGAVQRRIGEWHDWEQLAEIAHEFLEPERDGALLARIDEAMHQKLTRALAASNALRRQYMRAAVVHIPGC